MDMSISATQATTNTTNTTAKSKTQVDYDSFLKLLVAQMKNQDPTNPMDSTQYVAQLASFSQVEQSVNMNAKLDNLLQSSALAQANSLIGRTVTNADDTLSGKVVSVKLGTNSITAVLANGKEMLMGAGVKIS
jgi:flagellar basal-body rod modification protein FlgD